MRQQRNGTKNICYDLKLGSDYNLGKDLSKDERIDQLVKYNDTRVYI